MCVRMCGRAASDRRLRGFTRGNAKWANSFFCSRVCVLRARARVVVVGFIFFEIHFILVVGRWFMGLSILD